MPETDAVYLVALETSLELETPTSLAPGRLTVGADDETASEVETASEAESIDK